jgi:hypothetical protein
MALILAGSVSVSASLAASPAQLSVTGQPRALNNAYGGLAVEAGVLGTCPDEGVVCTGSGSITRGSSTLGSGTVYVSPGISQSITISFSKRGLNALKKKGKLRVTILVSLTGPDGHAVTATNSGTVRQPKKKR